MSAGKGKPDPLEIIRSLSAKISQLLKSKGPNMLATAKELIAKGGQMTTAKGNVPLGRPMKFPYTLSAKIAQFPLRFLMKNNWVFRYYAVSIIVCIPIFAYFTALSNTPGNVAKWEAIQKREREEHS